MQLVALVQKVQAQSISISATSSVGQLYASEPRGTQGPAASLEDLSISKCRLPSSMGTPSEGPPSPINKCLITMFVKSTQLSDEEKDWSGIVKAS